MNCFSGFRTEFLKAISVVSNSPSKGMFIDGCYSHCQTGMQETWMRNDSPVLANTVRHYIFLYFSLLKKFNYRPKLSIEKVYLLLFSSFSSYPVELKC